MVKKAHVPDAWDDDWEAQVDNEEGGVKLESETVLEPMLSKDELIQKHKEENKKVWQMAEDPQFSTPFHLLAKETVPLQQEFKPALKLLSRKPAGVPQDGESEEDVAKNKLSAEELRAKAQRDREEKQRKYEEVRARLFGTDDKSASQSPGNTTPTKDVSRNNSGRGRGRGRGGTSRGQSFHQQQQPQPYQQYPADDIRRPSSGQGGQRELFDPNYTPKPSSVPVARRNEGSSSSGRNTPKAIQDGEIIRGPRGPDYNGRGGFNFGNR